jgi:hypothetical protein
MLDSEQYHSKAESISWFISGIVVVRVEFDVDLDEYEFADDKELDEPWYCN